MNSFVKVSNKIFKYNLSPRAVFCYIYLWSRKDWHCSAIVKLAAIAKACNMDVKTVQAALKELQQANFITKVNRYNCRGYMANRYYLKNLLKSGQGWFHVPLEVFRTPIKSTDFVVFCYIHRCMDDKHEAFPSLTAIADATGISRGRVSKAVQYLMGYTYINRVRRRYKRTKAYRHNRYLKFKLAKRKACTIKVQAKLTTYSLTLSKTFVNMFFENNCILTFCKKTGGKLYARFRVVLKLPNIS